MKEQSKIRLFKAITIILPVLLLAIFEILLRIFHATPSLDLFVTYPENEEYYVFNPHFSERYFSKSQSATRGFYEPFKKEKDENTFRIFVQGASTAVGFPYFYNGSFHRMLKYRLEQTYPDRNIEIINLSLTAVNSYTLADQAKEIIGEEPDAVLIYAGHNEYYGALGVASGKNLFQNYILKKILIEFNQLYITQAFQNLFIRPDKNEQDEGHQNLMQQMAKQKEIPFGSDLYQEGLKQFERNLNILLKRYQKNNIPVFLSSIASNEKDLEPFISVAKNKQDSIEINNIIVSAENKLKSGDTLAAQNQLMTAMEIDSSYAKTQYLMAKTYLWQHDNNKAKYYFYRAKELDGLRFRAPVAINEIIRNCAEKYNAKLVDSRSLLEYESMNKIIGGDIMLEHVHPNLFGYSLIAEAFYTSILKDKIFGEPSVSFPFDEFIRKMPVTIIDSLQGAYATIVMKEKWPFNEPKQENIFGETKTIPEEIAGMLLIKQISWDQAMEELYRFYHANNDTLGALKVSEASVLEHPLNEKLMAKTAQLFAKNGDYPKAIFYYQKAFAINHLPEFARRIAQYLIQINELENAKQYLEYSMANDNSDRISGQALAAINEIQLFENESNNSKNTFQSYISLSLNYLKLGKKKKAYENFLSAKVLEPQNPIILDMEKKVFNSTDF